MFFPLSKSSDAAPHASLRTLATPRLSVGPFLTNVTRLTADVDRTDGIMTRPQCRCVPPYRCVAFRRGQGLGSGA